MSLKRAAIGRRRRLSPARPVDDRHHVAAAPDLPLAAAACVISE
jgi:hypothetical protein